MNNAALGNTAQNEVENTVDNVMGGLMSGDIGRVNRGTAAHRRHNSAQQNNITD